MWISVKDGSMSKMKRIRDCKKKYFILDENFITYPEIKKRKLGKQAGNALLARDWTLKMNFLMHGHDIRINSMILFMAMGHHLSTSGASCHFMQNLLQMLLLNLMAVTKSKTRVSIVTWEYLYE
jgi:hypothetical protein